jgi:carboxypeptidase C (cathepsin A)
MPEPTNSTVTVNTDVEKPPVLKEEEPVVTQHSGMLNGKKCSYTVTAGRMPLRNEKDEIVAQMFYISYTLDGSKPDDRRPLMFSFNGGPGSPSIWLHLGAVGPKRTKMLPDGQLPPPPYELVDNDASWLADTDLVFIDPIGTGFSRARTEEDAVKYWGVQGDIESVAEFIRLYLTRAERWSSPLYLVGESYGTTRAAGLAGYLVQRGIAFNGIVLVSSILNFQTARFHRGNDLPYILFLPTYTATAWYHGQLDEARQKDLQSTLKEAETFAIGEYASALAQGNLLSPNTRGRIVNKLSQLTGLSKTAIEQRNLRIEIHAFCKELLRKQGRTVGRLDSRFKGIDLDLAAYKPEHDPSMTALMPPYTSTFNDYVRRQLGYKTDLEYTIFHGIKKPWDWGSAGDGHPDTSEALRAAVSKNPYMKIYVASGYFDLATPYFATRFTLAHMGLDESLTGNFSQGEFEAGHMMYIHEPSLGKLAADVREFIASSKNS